MTLEELDNRIKELEDKADYFYSPSKEKALRFVDDYNWTLNYLTNVNIDSRGCLSLTFTFPKGEHCDIMFGGTSYIWWSEIPTEQKYYYNIMDAFYDGDQTYDFIDRKTYSELFQEKAKEFPL